jgi:tetratricopeptide (TPR) repeat protein
MAEKSLNELSRDLRVQYTKGTEALARDNFDYAISLFNQVLQREPGVYECRRQLRTAQTRKAGTGGGFFRKVLGSAGASPQIAKAQVALRTGQQLEAIAIAEQVLNNDPNSSAAHRVIVEAATALQMPQTAVLSLETLWKNSPKDKDIALRFAYALGDINESGLAERVLGELYRAHPGDNDVAQALKNLSARKTLHEGGYNALADGSGSYRDILKDKDEAASLEQQNRQVKSEDMALRLIREKEGRLAAEPDNIKLLRDLAELYTQKNEFDRALEYYQRIRGMDRAGDSGLDRAIAETTIRKYEYQVSHLDPSAENFEELQATIKAEKDVYELAEMQKRVERFPTDLQFRFELGQLYLKLGKVSEAIQEFQRAQANPHRRLQAMSGLAQAFSRRNMNDLAARTLQNALKEKTVFDDEKKDLIYQLGLVLEKMGKREEAVEQFKQIYEVDIGYKDVAAKVDAYYSGQGES